MLSTLSPLSFLAYDCIDGFSYNRMPGQFKVCRSNFRSHLVISSSTDPNLNREKELTDVETFTKGYIVSCKGLKSSVDMNGMPDSRFMRQTCMLVSGATVIASFQTVFDGFQFVKFTSVQKLTPMWSPNRNGEPFFDELSSS
uniref:Uncharacterized protein n=1 Tax=Oryza brachyantha TaxID=4533 RepID=J3L541_ORYBR